MIPRRYHLLYTKDAPKRLDINPNLIKIMAAEECGKEFEKLLDHCKNVYQQMHRGFSIRINKDFQNNYLLRIL